MQITRLKPQDNPPLLPLGEEPYMITLSNGVVAYAACWLERDTNVAPHMFGVIGVARAIEANGAPILTEDLQMIYGQGPAAVDATQLIVEGHVNESLREDMFKNALRSAINAMLAKRTGHQIALDIGIIENGTLSTGVER